MKEIRESFHAALNHLNKMSIQSGAITELAKLRDVNTMNEAEVKEEYKNALEMLLLIQDYALEAGEIVEKLKKKIYELLKIDASKPIE